MAFLCFCCDARVSGCEIELAAGRSAGVVMNESGIPTWIDATAGSEELRVTRVVLDDVAAPDAA